MTGRFTPAEGEPYGRCAVCGLGLADRAAASEHGRETMAPTGAGTGVIARGHPIHVLNPPREDLVGRAVSFVVDDAVVEAVNHLLGMLSDDGLSEDEVTSSLSSYPDFLDGWRDALDEELDEEGEGDGRATEPPYGEQFQLELPLDTPGGDDD